MPNGLAADRMNLPTEMATLTRKLVSPAGDDDYVRVAGVGKVGEKLLAAPLSRGAGVITSLVQADGLALIPAAVCKVWKRASKSKSICIAAELKLRERFSALARMISLWI